MKKKYIILIFLAFLSFGASLAQAEGVPAVDSESQEKLAPPANISDEALTSYISGRLNLLLKDENYKVSKYCDATGCSVVVQ
ncbi:MAG: hypothetical protein KAH96_05475 [Alphaproteobacteria bacterium]|nr:hypothetical protein [Alphaproteobacteria bacterium]